MKKFKKNSWDEHLTRLKNIFSSSHFSCICRIALIFNSASVFQLNTAVVKQKSQWVSHKKIFSHVAHFFTKTIQCGHFNEMGGCEVLDLFLSIYPLRDNEWAQVWRGEAKCKLILNIITHHSKSDFSLSLRHYSKQQTWKITNCRNFANSWNGNNFFILRSYTWVTKNTMSNLRQQIQCKPYQKRQKTTENDNNNDEEEKNLSKSQRGMIIITSDSFTIKTSEKEKWW